MTLRQLGNRMNISPQSVGEMENREANGTITLNSLKDMANALDMRLVYGFMPKDGSIEKMIEKKAREIAIGYSNTRHRAHGGLHYFWVV